MNNKDKEKYMEMEMEYHILNDLINEYFADKADEYVSFLSGARGLSVYTKNGFLSHKEIQDILLGKCLVINEQYELSKLCNKEGKRNAKTL